MAKAAHAVEQEAMRAGVWVYGAGLEHQDPSVVATDGTVTDGPYPESKEHIGGFAVVDVASREEALSGPPRSLPPAGVRNRCSSSCPTTPTLSEAQARHRRPGGDHPGPPRGVGAGGRRPDQAVR